MERKGSPVRPATVRCWWSWAIWGRDLVAATARRSDRTEEADKIGVRHLISLFLRPGPIVRVYDVGRGEPFGPCPIRNLG